MNIDVKAGDLAKGLGDILKILHHKNTIPILANVMLTAKDGQLEIRGTDLDLEGRFTLPVTIKEAGETTVAGRMLSEYVRKLDGAVVVTLRQDDNQFKIKAGKSNSRLHTLPVSDYPNLDIGRGAHEFVLTRDALEKLFGKTQFAISTEETRYYLNGVFLHRSETKLRAVATDGHRLARVDVDAPDGSDGMPPVIVPRKTVALVVSNLLGYADEVRVRVNATKIVFTAGPWQLVSKLIDGTFPDYGRVIPQGNNNIATLPTREFMASVDRVQTLTADKGRAAALMFNEGVLSLTVTNNDVGEAQDEIEVEYAGPDGFKIGFNTKYLHDILSEVPSEKCNLAMSDPGSPALFSTPDDQSMVFVLMPMRVA